MRAKRIGLAAMLFHLVACRPGDAVDTFLNQGSFGVVGNSALRFSPDSLSFAATKAGESKEQTMTITNVSPLAVYLTEVGATDGNFSVSGHDCPTSPAAFAPKAFCTLTVRFHPTVGGKLTWPLVVVSKSDPAANDEFRSTASVSGLGVSPLSFSGLETVSDVTATGATLSWSATSDALAFIVYRVESGELMQPQTVLNATGDVSSARLTGLTPGQSYAFRVRGIDTFGVADTNTKDVTVTMDPPGFFATVTALATSEGGSQSRSLSCTDAEGNTPTYSLLGQTDSGGGSDAQCSLSGATLTCAPAYKSGHADWSASLSLRCSLNENTYTQTVAVGVADTNRAPAISSITAGDTYARTAFTGEAVATIDLADGGDEADSDGDTLAYACTFSGGGQAAGTACSLLSGSVSFSASLGTLAWTPDNAAAVGGVTTVYTVTIQASDQRPAPLTHSRTFTITVNPSIRLTDIADRVFASGTAIKAGQAMASIDVNNESTSSDTGVTYACHFDSAVDGAVDESTAALCTTLPGVATFGTSTGVLAWTPATTTDEIFEIKLVGTKSGNSDAEIVKLQVARPIELGSTLLAHYDARWALDESPATTETTWRDLQGTNDAHLKSAAAADSANWTGSGSTSDPYRAVLDDNLLRYIDFGTGLNAAETLFAETWIKPSSDRAKGTVLFGNRAGSAGFQIQQSALGDGRIDFALGGKSYDDEVLADSPVLYLPFNESGGTRARDYSGNGNTATHQAAVTSGSTGILSQSDNRAIAFNGSTYSTCNTTNFPTAVPLTMEAWVYFNANQGAGDYDYVFQASNYNNQDLFAIARNASDNRFYYVQGATQRFGPALATGQWLHIVLVLRASAPYAVLYVNGVAQTVEQPSAAVAPTAVGCNIGRFSGNTHFLSNGSKIDAVALYSSELSASRVLDHYQAGSRALCRSQSSVHAGLWQHVSAYFRGDTDTLNLYYNGQKQCSLLSAGSSLTGSATSLRAGSTASATAWRGSLAEARFYDTGSDTAVTTNFDATKPRYANWIPMSGLKLWVSADTIVGVPSGQAVPFWADQSGSGNHLLAGTSAPLFQTGRLGPASGLLPAVQFDGTSQSFNFTTALSDIRTVIVVHRWTGTTGTYRALLGGSSTYEWITGGPGDTAEDKMASATYSAANLRNGSARLNRGTAAAPTTLAKPTSFAIYSVVTAGNTTADNLAHDRTISTRYFWGEIAELLIYNVALSDADRARVEDYLAAKYDIP